MMMAKKEAFCNTYKDIKPAVMTVGGWFDAEDLRSLNTKQ
jgi:inorganic pyrophosphatase